MTVHPSFISYRRKGDAVHARRLFDGLSERLGPDALFFDTEEDRIPLGTAWPKRLFESVVGCHALLAVIGPAWLDELVARNRNGTNWQSISASLDWVRKEVAIALNMRKPVIPVLVGGASLPAVAELPPDLRELPVMQFPPLPDEPGPARDRALDELAARLRRDYPTPTGPSPLWPRAHGSDVLPDSSDDIYSRYGRRWRPDDEKDSPHSYDYKFSVLGEESRQFVRVSLLAAAYSGNLGHSLDFAFLRSLGEPRKFAYSEKKVGLFVQASCLITDGLEDGQPRNVLLCVRDKDQAQHRVAAHAPDGEELLDPRHVDGESCLHSTCLTAFGKHDEFGHVPVALLPGLNNANPWALFSRKLLVPDPVIDCRFTGIGFNFSVPHREYVFLVWHVRTRQTPQAMQVPLRHQLEYDTPGWMRREDVPALAFEKAHVDRLVLEQCLGVRFPGRTDALSPLIGFVPCPGFDQTARNGHRPVRHFRDTVCLDLLKQYQVLIHRGRRPIPVNLLADVAAFLREAAKSNSVNLSVEPDGDALLLRLGDEAGREVYRFALLAVVGDEEKLSDDALEAVRRRLHDGFPGLAERDPEAVFVLHGVRSDRRYALQGAITVRDAAAPIHVIKVALLPAPGVKPVKRVAHAIVPVRRDGRADALLVTLAPDDELPRLPGGKIEGDETPEQAALRELAEELLLPDHEVLRITAVPGGPVPIDGVSPSTGELTDYQLYPFVVAVSPRGAERLRARVAGAPGPCRIAPVSLSLWQETGLGFDAKYARDALGRVPPEELYDTAFDL
jgi:8-oxo-dGTP pyrophosphatase MutT (NUDIX family)